MVAVSKAVILCGGSGKEDRLRPLSLDIPKPLFPIAGRAIIWHGIQALSKVQGLVEVLLIGSYDDAVFAHFVKEVTKDFPNLSIKYLREYQSLGTAGCLYHFRDEILRNGPDEIYVIHADIASTWPLAELRAFHDKHRGVGSIMSVQVPKEGATKYGCIIIDTSTSQISHYVEKPNEFISDTINGGVYLFHKSIFDEIRDAMAEKVKKVAADPTLSPQDDQLRLEQDVIAPLAASGKLYAFQTSSPWCQIKSAASALPANSLILASYVHTNPSLLRRHSPAVSSPLPLASKTKGPEIIEPCFIDESASIDPTAKIGPNVSIGEGVKIGFGARVTESIVLAGSVLERNSCVLHSILSEECYLGQWARVEGAPGNPSILAKDVSVLKEVNVRSCIVLPHKVLTKNAKNKVLL